MNDSSDEGQVHPHDQAAQDEAGGPPRPSRVDPREGQLTGPRAAIKHENVIGRVWVERAH